MDELPRGLRSCWDYTQELLRVDRIDAGKTAEIEALLAQYRQPGVSLRAVCDNQADTIARRLGGPDRPSSRILTEAGWEILDFGVIRPHHVFAVAALAALRELGSAPTEDAIEDVRYMADEAKFMRGRADLKLYVEREEARRRSENGAAGGRPPAFTDDELRAAWEQCLRERGGRTRGVIKYLSARLSTAERTIGEKALGRRLRFLGLRT